MRNEWKFTFKSDLLETVILGEGTLNQCVEWKYGKEEKLAFDTLKQLIASRNVLTFYDPDMPLKLDCDASGVGLGAVVQYYLM